MLIKKTHTVLFIPINGSGLGHLNRCLAYARHMPPSWRCVFFSLSAAIAPVLNMGYEVDYFLSHFWTTNNSTNWNRELAVRLGLLLEHVRPDVLLFDGVYPYLGLKRALLAYRKPLKLIWSRRGLQKNAGKEKDDSDLFDLVIQPGEIHDSPCRTAGADGKPPILTTPPVTLFDKEDLLPASEARRSLNLEEARRYILFSTGSGNLKNMETENRWLMTRLQQHGYSPIWLQPPISVKVPELPASVPFLEKYPIASCLNAFAGLVSAAGYNSCYEAAMAGLPALLLPNEKLLDDQEKRAAFLVEHNLAVISANDEPYHFEQNFGRFLELLTAHKPAPLSFPNGAAMAADAIVELVSQ